MTGVPPMSMCYSWPCVCLMGFVSKELVYPSCWTWSEITALDLMRSFFPFGANKDVQKNNMFSSNSSLKNQWGRLKAEEDGIRSKLWLPSFLSKALDKPFFLWKSWWLIGHLVDRKTGFLEIKEYVEARGGTLPSIPLSRHPFPKAPLCIIVFKSRWSDLDSFFFERPEESKLLS